MRPGYKLTEVGLIPESWEAKRLGEMLTICHGRNQQEVEDANGLFPILATGGQIGTASRALYERPSVLIGRKGTINQPRYMETPFWTVDTLFYSSINANNDAKFLYYKFCLIDWLKYNEASGVPSLNARTIENIVVAAPKPYEQAAISQVLSDVDSLLVSLDRLIAKKRDIKQAAMQQLLTGQTRLPGFQGEWVVKRLGDTASLKARIGWQGLTTAEYMEVGEFFLVTGTELSQGYIDWDRCHFVDESRYAQDTNIQLRQRDVLVTKDGTIGKVALVQDLPGPATLNSGVFVIRPLRDSFVPEYFYYVLCSRQFSEFLSQLAAGSTISHLYQKDFVSFSYRAPPTLDEQTEIAAVLFNMDAELAALEARRDKTRSLKQGMMQELLTGKTRIVKPEAADV